MEILLYAWCEDLGEFVKVQCDADGNLKVDLSNVNLNDLADVDAESPGDGEFLSFDLASGTWQARALTDADIPASIARDAEVVTAINNHAADSSAHHARYTDAEAVAAMGAKADDNPLNHDKYEAPDPVEVLNVVDDFISGSEESGEVGALGWSYSGTLSLYGSWPNHPGTVYLATASVADDIAYLVPYGDSQEELIDGDDEWELTFILALETITNIRFFVGVMWDIGGEPNTQERAGFEFDTGAGDSYWTMVTCDWGSNTRTASNVAPATSTMVRLKIVRTASGVEFYINGTLKGTLTTTLPSGWLQVGVFVQALADSYRAFYLDFFQWYQEGLSR